MTWYPSRVVVAPELSSALREALSAHAEIAVSYLFGSRARGDAREDSDIDIGLVFRRGGDAPESRERIAVQVAADVTRATGVERVDVVDLEEQGPIFCHRVLSEGERIHEADAARRVDFESDVLVRAFDFRPTYELATQGKVSALRRWLRRKHDPGAALVQAGRAEGEPR
ncbi:MAG: nucleotidyltransferase domain-containing protein [Sorangiineae bacterium PRO1]|nr:nucleotidyltransferase domain-containing protein [Sorangiineae bacterium PRO1]